jgi:HEXXH motif-containing protein
MPAFQATTYDEAALVAFRPDGSRAKLLYARMIDCLAQSVEEIIQGSSSHLEFGETIRRLPDRVRASSRIAPEVYCIYFDLLQTVRRDDLDACVRLLGEMDTRLDAPLPSFYARWGRLPESAARRYLSSFEFYQTRQLADEAFRVLDRAAPEIAAEIRALLTEIVFVSGEPNHSVRFDGATSFFCWGALFLNADTHRGRVKMIEGLSHESAHAYLFALSLGESLVNNSDDELHSSPLRDDPRPLDGTFHATYVSARMHYALRRLMQAGVLSDSEKGEASNSVAASRAAFLDGLETLNEHASLTPLGCRVMNAARDYMGRCS